MAQRLNQEGLLWLEKYTENMIKELHERLEAPYVSMEETNIIRGEIRRARLTIDDAKSSYQQGTVI